MCVEQLIHTISLDKNIRFEDPLCTNEHMVRFDFLLQQIIRICAKYGSRLSDQECEQLWMFAIKKLFEVKHQVYKRKREMQADSDNESDSSADRERHEEEMQFEKFVLIRNQYFLQKMSEHVNLNSIISFLEDAGHALKYDDFRRIFEEKIQTEMYFIGILNRAVKLVGKEVTDFSAELSKTFCRGYKTHKTCDKCKNQLVNKFDKQDIWLLSCQHVFHARCVAKSDGNCCVCFNEMDVICKFSKANQL
jgi:hypothetical protein